MITKKSHKWAFTNAEWERALELWEGCAYCRRFDVPMARDHFIPEVLGGVSSLANIVPACKNCNSSKGMENPIYWRWTADIDVFWRVVRTMYNVYEIIYGFPPIMDKENLILKRIPLVEVASQIGEEG